MRVCVCTSALFFGQTKKNIYTKWEKMWNAQVRALQLAYASGKQPQPSYGAGFLDLIGFEESIYKIIIDFKDAPKYSIPAFYHKASNVSGEVWLEGNSSNFDIRTLLSQVQPTTISFAYGSYGRLKLNWNDTTHHTGMKPAGGMGYQTGYVNWITAIQTSDYTPVKRGFGRIPFSPASPNVLIIALRAGTEQGYDVPNATVKIYAFGLRQDGTDSKLVYTSSNHFHLDAMRVHCLKPIAVVKGNAESIGDGREQIQEILHPGRSQSALLNEKHEREQEEAKVAAAQNEFQRTQQGPLEQFVAGGGTETEPEGGAKCKGAFSDNGLCFLRGRKTCADLCSAGCDPQLQIKLPNGYNTKYAQYTHGADGLVYLTPLNDQSDVVSDAVTSLAQCNPDQ